MFGSIWKFDDIKEDWEMITKQADVQNTDNIRWLRESNFATINTTDSKKGFPIIVKIRTI